MLEEIRISSLGVIEESVLELGPGFTAITGETGAGKTMVVTALGLLLGGRADSGAVRTGARAARIEGLVRLTDGQPWAAELATAVELPLPQATTNLAVIDAVIAAGDGARDFSAVAGHLRDGRIAEEEATARRP